MESPAVSGLRPVEPQLVESLSGGEGGVCATKPSASLTPHIDFRGPRPHWKRHRA